MYRFISIYITLIPIKFGRVNIKSWWTVQITCWNSLWGARSDSSFTFHFLNVIPAHSKNITRFNLSFCFNYLITWYPQVCWVSIKKNDLIEKIRWYTCRYLRQIHEINGCRYKSDDSWKRCYDFETINQIQWARHELFLLLYNYKIKQGLTMIARLFLASILR